MLALLLTGFFALTFPFAYADGSFGNTSTGASSYQPWQMRDARGTKFTAPESGNITALTARIYAISTENFQAGVYSDNAGAPNILLGSSENVSVGTSEAWVSFTLTSPVPIVASTPYWLVVKSWSANYYFKYDNGDISQSARCTYVGAIASPFGTPTYLDYSFCIYANYTTAVAGEENFTLELNTPANDSTVTDYLCDFTFTPTLLGSDNFQNATLYLNGTSVASNSTAIENATSNTISYVLPGQNATYLWDVKVWNSTNALFSTNGNFTLNVAVSSVAATSEEDIIAAVMFSCIVACSVTGVAVYAKKKH